MTFSYNQRHAIPSAYNMHGVEYAYYSMGVASFVLFPV